MNWQEFHQICVELDRQDKALKGMLIKINNKIKKI